MLTDLPGIARAAQATTARLLRAARLGGPAAGVLLHRAAALAAAAYDLGVPVAQVHPPLIPLHRRVLRMTATPKIPAPRTPADPSQAPYADALQRHVMDEADHPETTAAFHALAARATTPRS